MAIKVFVEIKLMFPDGHEIIDSDSFIFKKANLSDISINNKGVATENDVSHSFLSGIAHAVINSEFYDLVDLFDFDELCTIGVDIGANPGLYGLVESSDMAKNKISRHSIGVLLEDWEVLRLSCVQI